MKRPLTLAAVVLVALAAKAGPANAHEEISPTSVVTGRSVFLTFTAANERQVALTGVTLVPPAGLRLGPVTREPQGWAVVREPTGYTWSGGPMAPGKFEQWGVELEAPDQPGSFIFRSTLRFADGRTDSHDVPLTVSSTTAPETAAQSAVAAPTPTTAATVPAASASPPPAAGVRDVGRARRQANLALGIGTGGLAVAIVALIVAGRRPRAGGVGGRVAREEQQW